MLDAGDGNSTEESCPLILDLFGENGKIGGGDRSHVPKRSLDSKVRSQVQRRPDVVVSQTFTPRCWRSAISADWFEGTSVRESPPFVSYTYARPPSIATLPIRPLATSEMNRELLIKGARWSSCQSWTDAVKAAVRTKIARTKMILRKCIQLAAARCGRLREVCSGLPRP